MSNSNDAHLIALEWLKHLITLSSSIVVFSGTLIGLVLDKANWSLWILAFSWVLFISVILLSLEAISTITYSRINEDDSWTEGKGKDMALAAKWCFTCGLITFALFAVINVSNLITLIENL